MSSDEARPARRKAQRRDDAQGTLEGLLAADEETDEAGAEDSAPAPKSARPARRRERSVSRGEGEDRVRASLDALEESVKLLVARHAEAVKGRSAAESRNRKGKSLDAVALKDRVRELEAETERLERHAAFLEDRIRALLSRVRYVIES